MFRATVAGLARVGEQDKALAAPATATTVATEAALQTDANTGVDAKVQTDGRSARSSHVRRRYSGPSEGSDAARRPRAGQHWRHGTNRRAAASTPLAAPTAPARANRQATLRQAAQALIEAGSEPANREHDSIRALDGLFADLRCVSAWNFDPLSWGIGVQN